MNTDTLVFGWCCTIAAGIALGLSLTLARSTLLGGTVARWLFIIFLLGGAWKLANIYSKGTWPLYLLWIIGPILLGVIAAEYRFRIARKGSS